MSPLPTAFWLPVLVVVAVAALSLAFAPAPDPVENRPLEVRGEEYVSSQTCRACHPAEHASWDASYHNTMTQVATPASVLAPPDGGSLSVYGASYRFERRGDEYWVTEETDAASSPDPLRVVMTTGSHHFQAYWLETGERRKVRLFPFAWRIAEQAWMPFDAIFLSPPEPAYRFAAHSAGLWNGICAQCHATGYRPRLKQPGGMDTLVAELGIACEACHGPAERHVSLNRSPGRRYALYADDDGDPSIVHPERLPHQRSSEVCGQCHSVHTVSEEEDFEAYLERGSGYRPGDVLAEQQTLLLSDGEQTLFSDIHTHFWSDGVIRVNGREYNSLLRSPCFQRGEMSCLSCHQMHQASDDPRPRAEWANDQLQPGMDGSAACLSCHRSFGDEARIAAHTRHAPTSVGSDCLNCHMPYTAWGLQKATRSHEIASPTVAESLETGRPNACNLCHLDRSLAWTAEKLEGWYGIGSPPLDEEQRSIAAAARWILAGDAGQRALVTWAMGWEPARLASGEDWMAPYLGVQLLDPYPTSRFAALRSLRQLEGFEDFRFEPMDSLEERRQAVNRLMHIFGRRGGAGDRAHPGAVLMEASGELQERAFRDLIDRRNNRRVSLME